MLKTLPANSFQVHEVAITTTVASILLILPASCLTKVCHRREINNDWATCKQVKQQLIFKLHQKKKNPIIKFNHVTTYKNKLGSSKAISQVN